MPGDLTIQPILQLAAEPRPTIAPVAVSVPLPASSATGPRPNPNMRIDPALRLVVVEFRDVAGRVTASLPDVHQLDAYRRAQQSGIPPGTLHKLATRVL